MVFADATAVRTLDKERLESIYGDMDPERRPTFIGIDEFSLHKGHRCPYDNSVCESFFKYLKKEETDRYRYRTFEQLMVSILGYIDGYYNSRRLHSSIGYMTPNEKDASFYRKR